MGGEGESSESAINPFFRMRREEEFFYSSFFLISLIIKNQIQPCTSIIINPDILWACTKYEKITYFI
jgi:hypothetical protein